MDRLGAHGPFTDVREASNFLADRMSVGKRPQFSANEAAKDFAYIEGSNLLLPSSHHRCNLGPGAKKGLALVRAREGTELHVADCSQESAVIALQAALREVASLDWVEAIDVEQALCEFSKYVSYCTNGVSAGKRFIPQIA